MKSLYEQLRDIENRIRNRKNKRCGCGTKIEQLLLERNRILNEINRRNKPEN